MTADKMYSYLVETLDAPEESRNTFLLKWSLSPEKFDFALGHTAYTFHYEKPYSWVTSVEPRLFVKANAVSLRLANVEVRLPRSKAA